MIHRALPRLFFLSLGLLALAIIAAQEWFDETAGPTDEDADDDGKAHRLRDLVETAAQTGPFGTLGVALKTAGLVETLEGDGPFTVFAPTDDAFAALGETLDELLADPGRLAKILEGHVIEGTFGASAVAEMSAVETLAGTSVAVDATDGVRVGGAKVVEADVMASNGIIHGIDKVLLPPAPGSSTKKSKKAT